MSAASTLTGSRTDVSELNSIFVLRTSSRMESLLSTAGVNGQREIVVAKVTVSKSL